ncbi:uncharacterized protein MONOS_11670 [Monocercomonoides exilis]|uniref:uncharacterized protein n=1 Tax=Monocercomonoides exilis TaxID=2049356 RepID=UPI0035597F83|nr:hypothetical protein MONOS_11670 [Monocercomonoides exilis]|eukprot:MONOS_11670.1-p1 / transcript=MONOS_11670.1 / gene=MONOS_11670 / organism=Monocercomonoides_exilis_PA203 / gene_product=unspecified product / transcript_product=unspecified product / location=Mono_scaffold00599:35120-35913(-) / protein_length=225 / sequence_SO=supercontig / SO=protein_coding / is_pseudo=false
MNRQRSLQPTFIPQLVLTTVSSEHAWGATLRVNNMILDWRAKSDNSSVVFNVNRWNAEKTLRPVLNKIWKWKEAKKVQMKAQHLPGARNNRADSLSRLERAGDYTIKEKTFKKVTSLTKVKPTLDAFAALQNHIMERWSSIGSPISEDRLTILWSQECFLVHPPIPLIPIVIRKAQQERAQVVQLLPNWKGWNWEVLSRESNFYSWELDFNFKELKEVPSMKKT